MFRLFPDIHLTDIGSLYWEKHQSHAPCRIMKISVNAASTVLVVAYLVIKALRESLHS